MSAEILAEALSSSDVATIRSEVASIEIDREAVIYDDGARMMHRLNPTATVVWNCLDGSATLAEIAADIADAYGADPEGVLSDVIAVARQLGAKGLLVGVRRDPDDAGSEDASPEDASLTDEASGNTLRADDDPFVAEPPGP